MVYEKASRVAIMSPAACSPRFGRLQWRNGARLWSEKFDAVSANHPATLPLAGLTLRVD